MRIHRVRLRNYRGITESDVSFSTSGVTIVEGPNEVGKTSIPEALRLAIELPDSSQHARIKSIKPVGRDEGPEVEITLSSGNYEFVFRKRWLRDPETTLRVAAPHGENLTGREAHDRLQAILTETLDEELWHALRIEQGTELALPFFDLPSLGRALDRAAGGDLATDREDILWDRVGEEYDKYWTPGGQAKGARKSSNRSVDEVQTEVRELKGRLEEIESDTTKLSQLVADSTRLANTKREYEKRESDLTNRWESTQGLQNEVERLTSGYEAAQVERDRTASEQESRQELIDTLDTRTKTLDELEAEAERAAPVLAAAERHREKATSDLDDARIALRSAEDKQRLAYADRDYLRQKIEVEQLRERHGRYLEAEKSFKEAEGIFASAKIDDDLLDRIEGAFLEDVRAKAAADSAAAQVETTALRDITVRIDDEEVRLAAQEVKRIPVEDEVVLVIPDVARMRVNAGPESRGLADRRSNAQETYRRLCEEGGVADQTEARTAAQQRREAQRNRKEALKAIQRDLRDLTPDVLIDKVKGLSKRVASYPQERPGNPPLPSDYEDAKRIADGMERSVADCQTECQTREEAVESAAEALHQAQLNERVLHAKIDDARTSKQEAEARLITTREKRADADLTAALALAQQRVEDAHKSLGEAEAKLIAADPDSLEVLLDNAREARRRATEELQSNRERQTELRISLDLRGEEGLHSLHDEALTKLQHIKRDHERTEARAEAARLLHKTFAKHRQEARQRYVEPFKERIDQLGRIVFGPTFAIELDDDLKPVRRTLDGATLAIGQLSTGAREQLGVLSRLACAAIVSPDGGGAPVMIDDALGWSDPQRLQSMGAAITSAGKQCQVIVLTCTPGRYSHVGQAKVVILET